MTPNSSSLAEFIKRLAAQIYERTLKGELAYEEGVENLKRYAQLADEAGNQDLICRMNNMLGLVEMEHGHFAPALDYFQFVWEVANDHSIGLFMALAQNNLGEIYRRQQLHTQALTAFQKALEIYQTIDTPARLITTHTNMGLTLIAKGEDTAAYEQFQTALRLSETLHVPRESIGSIIEARVGLAEVALFRQDFDKVWELLRIADESLQGLDFKLLVAHIQLIKARTATLDPRHQAEAAKWYDAARRTLEMYPVPHLRFQALVAEAEYYLAVDTPLARRLAQEAVELAQTLQIHYDVARVELLLKAGEP